MSVFEHGEFWALAASGFWAIAVVLFRLTGREVAPIPLNLFKNVLGLILFIPLLVVTVDQPLPPWSVRVWLQVILSGVVGLALADTLFFMELNRLGAGLTAVVGCLYFPVMVVLAYAVLGQTTGATAIVGGLLVVAAIVVGSADKPPEGTSTRTIVEGVAIGAASVVCIGIGVMLLGDLLATGEVLAATTYRLLAGTLFLLPLGLFGKDRAQLFRLFRPSPWWRYAVPASVLGGALAMWSWLYAFSLVDVAIAAILNQLSTIWIFVLAYLFLKESMTSRRASAVVLAMVGVVLVVNGG